MASLRLHRRWGIAGRTCSLLAIFGIGCTPAPTHPDSQLCSLYIVCYESTGGTRGELEPRYGQPGTCWLKPLDDQEICLRECLVALNNRIAAYPDAGCSVR
jgi:hypothetical protein